MSINDALNKFENLQMNILEQEQQSLSVKNNNYFTRQERDILKKLVQREINILMGIDEKPKEKIDLKSDFAQFEKNIDKKSLFQDKLVEQQEFRDDDIDSQDEVLDDEDDFIKQQRKLIKNEDVNQVKELSKQQEQKEEQIEVEEEESTEVYQMPIVETQAGEKFGQMLLLEKLEREKKEQKKRDLEELEAYNKKIKDMAEQKQQQKSLEKQRIIDEQAEQLAMYIREQKKKSQKLEEEYQKQEEEEQQKLVEKYKQELLQNKQNELNAIFELNQNSVYNTQICSLQSISCIPSNIISQFVDINQYLISREGITSRYQILIFPKFLYAPAFVQFMTFFITNSVFNPQVRKNPDLINDTNSFPFYLIGFLTGAEFYDIYDHVKNKNFPDYLRTKQILNQDFTEKIYLVFDTYVGRGKSMLGDQLQIQLSKVFSEDCLQKMISKQIINNQKNLKDLLILHLKNMNFTQKMMQNQGTFHILSRQPIQGKQFETSLVIIRNFQPNHLFQLLKHQNQETEQTEETFSQTQFTEQSVIIEQNNILKVLLEKTTLKGLEIVALKSVYLDQQNIQDIQKHISSNLGLEQSEPIICLTVQGQDCIRKMNSIVGNQDSNIARATKPNSLNALFYIESQKTIVVAQKKVTDKLISYLFSGRLPKLDQENLETILEPYISENILDENSNCRQVFQIVQTGKKELVLLFKDQFKPMNYGDIMKIIEKMGFEVDLVKAFSKEMFEIATNHSQKWNNFGERCLAMIIKGGPVKPLLQKLCTKIVSYSKLSFQSKKDLILHSFEQEDIQLFKNLLQYKINDKQIVKNFTICKNIYHFALIWPKNELKDLGDQLNFFGKKNCEIIALSMIRGQDNTSQKNVQILDDLIQLNLNFQTYFKKKPEFKQFTQKLALHVFKQDLVICLLRLQENIHGIDIFFKFIHFLFIRSKLYILVIIKQNASQIIILNVYFQHQLVQKNNIKLLQNLQQSKQLFFNDFIMQISKIQFQKIYLGREDKWFDDLYKTIYFLNSSRNLQENYVIQSQISDLPFKLIDQIFLRLENNDIQNCLRMFNSQANDDISLKKSVIYDVVPNNCSTLLILPKKCLNQNTLIKRIYSKGFDIKQMIHAVQLDPELNKTIFGNLIETQDLSTMSKSLNDSIETFKQLIDTEYYLIVEVQKENSIFDCKLLAKDLTKSLMIYDTNLIENFEKVSVESRDSLLYEYQINFGIYSSVNYKSSLQEINVTTMNHFGNKSQMDKNKNYQLLSVLIDLNNLKINDGLDLYDFIEKFIKSDILLLEVLILKQIDSNQAEQISSLINGKFEQKSIFNHLNSNLNSSYALLLFDRKKVVSLSNFFGTFRISEKGEILQVIKGSVLGDNKKKTFLVYNDNQDQNTHIYQHYF